MLRAFSTACASLLLFGCVTYPPDRLPTEIVTFPPGARIEVNGKFRGNEPVRVILSQDSKGHLIEDVTIRAVPVVPGRFAQTRKLTVKGHPEIVPGRIMIDLRQPDPGDPSTQASTKGEETYAERR